MHAAPHFTLPTLLLGLLLGLSPAVNAQPAAGQPPAARDDDTITMNMRDADIRALIQWVADQTGRNMVVHRDVKGQVTVLSSKPVTRDEAWQVFLAVLQTHGYAAIDSEGAVKIVPAEVAVQSGIPYRSTERGDMVVQVFRANHVSAVELAQLLRPLVSKDAVINADATTNMLLVADHSNNVAQLQRLVQQLDSAGSSGVELVRLEHANAAEVLASLTALFPTQTGVGATGGGGGGGEGVALPLMISADSRSNAILLSGDPARRSQVRQLIRSMDRPLTGGGNTQVLYLQYIDAKEVVPILRSVAESVLSERREEKTTPFSIESSDSANALVVNAPPGLMGTLQEVARKLDVRRTQVLVEALIVEVNQDVADDLGVTWITTDAELDGSGGFGAVNTLGSLAPAITDQAGNFVGPGRGLTFGYYESGDIRAAIRALSSTTKANILSTPTVVAIDNEPASLLVGQNVPFITGSATNAAADVENPFQTIERRDIGISLEVIPRINRGDSITLEITQKVENIAPSVANASDLITNKREIVTKAIIKDDTVLVLGGLISDDESEARDKVPILGDLPLIGRLFSSTGKSRVKQNLMVFIHPVILRDGDHSSEVSRLHYDYMRGQQQRALTHPPTTTEKKEPSPRLEDFEVFSPVRSAPAR